MDLDMFLHFLFVIPCGFLEIYITIKKYSSTPKSQSKDRGTLIFIWLIVACSQAFSIHYIRLDYGSKIIENKSLKYFFWIPFNIILYLMGNLIRQQSIKQLGKWFTTAVRIDENQQLIHSGWYARVRHPSYAGLLIYFLALVLFLNNWFALIGMMIPISSVFFYRIHVEEQELEKHFGIKYEEYRQKVPGMIIPKLF